MFKAFVEVEDLECLLINADASIMDLLSIVSDRCELPTVTMLAEVLELDDENQAVQIDKVMQRFQAESAVKANSDPFPAIGTFILVGTRDERKALVIDDSMTMAEIGKYVFGDELSVRRWTVLVRKIKYVIKRSHSNDHEVKTRTSTASSSTGA